MQEALGHGPGERRRQIRSLIGDQGRVRITDLAADFGVSEMTIRRDLDELQALGVLRRVRGGAVAVGPELFADRHGTDARAKGVIAEKLQALIPPRGTVAFDASSTMHRLAADLQGAQDLVLVTNGIDTFQVLADKPGITPTLTGGSREPRTSSLVGPVAVRSARDFLFDVFVCSAAALDAELGSSEASLAEAEVKRTLRENSAQVVLAVSHSKLDTRSRASLFKLSDIDVLVTDLDPDDPRLAAYCVPDLEIR